MPRFYQVVPSLPQVKEAYEYHLPEELEEQDLEVGSLVVVPFGHQLAQGVVLQGVKTPSIPATRPIHRILDPHSVLPAALLKLASRLAEEYLTPLGEWIAFLLPEEHKRRSDWLYRWKGAVEPGEWPSLQRRIVAAIQAKGALRGSQLDHRFPRIDWRRAIQPLVRRGIIEVEPLLLSPRVRQRRIKLASLSIPPSQVESFIEVHGSRWGRARERRRKVLEFLAKEGKPVEVAWVYAECGADWSDLKRLADSGAIRLDIGEQRSNPETTQSITSFPLLELTQEQSAAWEPIRTTLHQAWQGNRPKPILLHGVTGSGKTELYLRAVAETLAAGKQAIVLVPEISLTPQTVARFSARFREKVGVYHSRLSLRERSDIWQRCRKGCLSVIVGARSALFLPFDQPGLVVVDECHDPSYYQDSQPNYHTVQAALTYMEIAGGACLFGSATPAIEQSFWARQGLWQEITLSKRILHPAEGISPARWSAREAELSLTRSPADERGLSAVKIVDMRAELKAGNRSIFSRVLSEKLRQVLAAGEQAILFLNRRGSATYVFCRNCGYVVRCPQCKIPLAVHALEQSSKAAPMLCHRCGYRRLTPQRCPNCGSPHIRQMGIGTQRVEQEVRRLFPEARVLRWDADTTKHKGAHEQILRQFSLHQANVLIGTQMLSKGLDLPSVTLVGVILAEVGLNLPDFRAAERTFQLLTQVAGRAGRSALGGEVIIQTYEPEHYAIKAAASQDYECFYQKEIRLRKEIQYPPFAELVRLEYRHLRDEQAQTEAKRQYQELQARVDQENISNLRLAGPLPCYFSPLAGWYRWQILLIGEQPRNFLHTFSLRRGWRIEINPPSLL
ncbi:MAG: primosomal protein N' [Anaerolineales bacterium]|nr:primosomal protein N' [Anaerolineales bacterium]MDW8446983.1 primosomal protein N' [Anaerolineales bacterium]